MKKTALEVRKEVTESIAAAMQTGVMPWRKPWSIQQNIGNPCNFQSKHQYRGINPLILFLSGHNSKYWGSYNAFLKELGAVVKGGEKATYIVYFNMVAKRKNGKPELNDKGEEMKVPLLRTFPVFNVEQLGAPKAELLLSRGPTVAMMLGCKKGGKTTKDEMLAIAEKYSVNVKDNWSLATIAEAIEDQIVENIDKLLVKEPESRNSDPDFEAAEEFVAATKVEIKHGGNRAFYTETTKSIQMPHKKNFDSITHYYETLFHELVHWGDYRVGKHANASYAFNELVAEIGAAFLLMELGVPMADQLLPQTQSYVAAWLKNMGDDPKFIFDASSQASKVVDFLLGFIGRKQELAA